MRRTNMARAASGRRPRALAWGACVLLAAAIAAGCKGPSSRVPHATWQESRRYLYSARLVSGAALAGQSPFTFDLTAKVELVPLRVAGSKAELAMQLSDLRLEVGGRVLPVGDDLVAALTRPYLFTLDGGLIVEQRLSGDLPVVAAGIQRSLSAAYQLAQPPARADKWTASERDTTGAYRAEYVARDGGAVTKRKLSYEDIMVAGSMDPGTRSRVAVKIIGSKGELRVAGGTLASIRLEDVVESQVLSKVPLTVTTKLTIDLEEVSGARAGGPDRAALLAQTVAHPVGQAYGDGRANGLFDKARLDGRSFDELVGELEAEARDAKAGELWQGRNGSAVGGDERTERERRLRGRVATFGALVALLRLQSKAVEAAAAKVRAHSVAAPALMDGLAAAGTETAQAVLAGLVADPKLGRGLKIAAVNSLIDVKRPGPEAVETVEDLVSDPLLQEPAVFGLGTMARRLREAGDVARSAKISELLLKLLGEARKRDDQIRCLRGIANSAYPGALESVRPLLAGDDPGVRAAAVEAARLMAGSEVDAFVAAPMTTDTDAQVRLTAVQVAARRAPSPVLEAALSQVALHDNDTQARRRAVEVLGGWLATHRSLRPTLEQVSSKDDRPEVREAAKAALTKA